MCCKVRGSIWSLKSFITSVNGRRHGDNHAWSNYITLKALTLSEKNRTIEKIDSKKRTNTKQNKT